MTSLKKINSLIINSPWTYFILLMVIAIQFILILVMLNSLNKQKYILEQTSFKAASIENRQNQIGEQLNGLQSNIMRVSAQLYRLQSPSK